MSHDLKNRILKTRKPTGHIPWPLILIEGAEKSGKSYACAQLTASEKVGQTYWLDLGEGSADEYAALPGADYLVVDHDGTWTSIYGSVEAIRDEAQTAQDNHEKPVVLIIDSMTAEWDLLKDWASGRARDRLIKKGRTIKPDAEVDVSMDLWNDAAARHRRLMACLMTFPGIVVMTARGKEVAAIDASGKPIPRASDYKVEGQKNLAFDASVWVRLSRDTAPTVVGARSLHAGVRPGVDKPREIPDFTLEWLIFDLIRCNTKTAQIRNLEEIKADSVSVANSIRDRALDLSVTVDALKETWNHASKEGVLQVEVINETGDQEILEELIKRRANDLKGSPVSVESNGAGKTKEALPVAG